MKTKSWYKSTSIWSGTALIVLVLSLLSLYFKAIGHSIGEAAPMAILSIGTYIMNVRGRVQADSKLTL